MPIGDMDRRNRRKRKKQSGSTPSSLFRRERRLLAGAKRVTSSWLVARRSYRGLAVDWRVSEMYVTDFDVMSFVINITGSFA